MTLIVGVKCSDGIVLGADTSATYGTPLGQQSTIRQDTATKLGIIFNQVALGVSGPISLSQSYCAEVESYMKGHGNRVRWRSIEEAKIELTKMFWKHAGPTWERAGIVAKTVGAGAALGEANHGTAIALSIGDTAHLVQFSAQCAPEEATEGLPFVSLGSGQPLADPFLAFLRRIYWPTGLPSLLDGQIATVWTLDQAIRVNPGGIAGETQIVVLKRDTSGRNWICDAISNDELGEHRRVINDLEDKMRERSTLATTPTATTEAVPTPPSAQPTETAQAATLPPSK
jgi:hypothetical protein